MKTKNLLLGLLCLLTLPTTFIACDDDEFVYYTDMSTVTDRDGRWVLESDNCGELIPLNTAALTMHDADKDNQRVIAAFNYVDEKDRSNKGIELYDIYRVLTKDVYCMPADDAEANDSIGNDPIHIRRITTSAKHLNFYFSVMGNNSTIAHFINLITVGDKKEPDSNGVLHMEFRHNNEGDHPRFPQWAWAAFPLSSIPGYTEGKTKKLSIKVYEGNDTETIISYDLTDAEKADASLEKNAKEYAISDFSNTKTK